MELIYYFIIRLSMLPESTAHGRYDTSVLGISYIAGYGYGYGMHTR